MTTLKYQQASTAFLIVDPYNDFMSEGGKYYDATKETANAVGFYQNMRKLIAAVRAAKLQVFIVPHHRSCAHEYEGWKQLNPLQVVSRDQKAFEKDTWGGEFNPEFGPQPGDVVIQEHWAQNGFAHTDLDPQLKQHGIDKLILVGFIANSCVESTARMGMELGYHVTLVKDATGAFDAAGMNSAHNVNGPMYAHEILTSAEVLAALPAPMTETL